MARTGILRLSRQALHAALGLPADVRVIAARVNEFECGDTVELLVECSRIQYDSAGMASPVVPLAALIHGDDGRDDVIDEVIESPLVTAPSGSAHGMAELAAPSDRTPNPVIAADWSAAIQAAKSDG